MQNMDVNADRFRIRRYATVVPCMLDIRIRYQQLATLPAVPDGGATSQIVVDHTLPVIPEYVLRLFRRAAQQAG